jgi:hypothetical protein
MWVFLAADYFESSSGENHHHPSAENDSIAREQSPEWAFKGWGSAQ